MRRFFVLFALLAVLVFYVFSCQNDDDDDNDDNDNNDTSDEAYADCIPELPGNVDRDILVEILDAYFGTWINNEDNQRIITCRPAGDWGVPNYMENAPCIYSWTVPVWVEFSENGEKYLGEIFEEEPVLVDGGYGCLGFETEEGHVGGVRSYNDEGEMRIFFGGMAPGDMWVRP